MNSLFVTRVSVPQDEKQKDLLVVFNSRGDVDDLALSHEIREDLEEHLEPSDILVVVHQSVFDKARTTISESSYVEQAIERFRPGVCMSLVAFDGLGNETNRTELLSGRKGSTIPIEAILRPGITDIFRRRKGFVEASPNYHFENPSGKHTRRFIRLSNLISTQPEISFMGFALLGAVPDDCDTIYTDTPSAFPVIAAMNEHRRASGLPFVAAENFSSYSVMESKGEIEPTDTRVLISASSSGSLAKAICAKLGYPKEHIWHFLFSGPSANDHQIICNLDFDERCNTNGVHQRAPDYSADACLYCESGSFPIPLYGDQFELPGPQLDELQLTVGDEPTGLRKVIGKYAGKNVFGVGMGARQSGFARQFNINVQTLSALPEFTSDLDYILKRTLPAATNTIVYLDKPSILLAEKAQDVLEANGHTVVKLVDRDNLDKITLEASEPIVIVAAAVESGRSLLDLSRDLRTVCADSPLVYILAVSKSSGFPRREELAVNLAMTSHAAKHEVVIGDTLLLPASSEGHSWHRERAMLLRLIESGVHDPDLAIFLNARVELLRDENSILTDDLFWTNGDGPQLEVQKGFVFALPSKVNRYSQADVYFTISSVLQKLRSTSATGSRAIRSNWFQQTLLSPANFGRFNDGAIQASILRAALPKELNYSGHEELSREAGRIISRIVKNASEARGEAAAEFLLALATRSLILRAPDLETVLSNVPDGMPRLSVLKQVCEDRADEPS